ncbi:TonB-dependent receptor [Fulvivirgaceae bacterium BMA10]|uniref:TonB-dependent receptor n=1 Tax=Splendidivirga corallicola TaxID=3051826 RepID=A0ABT8KP63_9BACT|nr:TonB-dependent receptor [Fulvivirgaceae bacterium BMA10]
MKNYRIVKFIALIWLCIFSQQNKTLGQEILRQTVKGTIIDQDSNAPIIGANVMVVDSDPILGGSTGIEGEFRIENVPLGRITLLITSIGYENRIISDVLVGAGKEVVINASLEESLVKLDEIVIKDKENKSVVSNEMVQVSGRTFSVEETNRYAGTFNDPARAVSSFAGIQSNAEGSNHIVVRGNSPNNIQWRMEGIEIPNPNHFADEGSSGGSINILSGRMLTNSDFYSGAFDAEYGNVLSGVFDMKMRTGNRDKREYSIGVGILGTDITLEGPFAKGGKSSYLANYRYSTLGLLDNLGVVDFGGVPKYQDLSFKLSFPTSNAGLFTVFGIGGLSTIKDEIKDDETDELVGKDDFSASMGTVNLGHTYFLNNNSSIESFLSFSQNGSGYELQEKEGNLDTYKKTFDDELNKYTLRAGTSFLSKINAKNTLRTGINYHHFIYDFKREFLNNQDVFETWLDDDNDTGMIRAFATWKHRLNKDWTVTGGVHYTNLLLNNSQTVEPRASVKYQLDETQSVFAGFGLHSQMPSLTAYYSIIEDQQGNETRPNLDVDLMKAIHYVIGYDRMLSENLYFKTEVYYQDLYDIPVENDPGSSYSLLNAVDGFADRALVNEGSGTNYGVELTLEKYFSKNYYFLLTGSLFQSKYKALDKVERNTRFNGNYLTNFLFGKELYLGGSKNKVISLNTKISWTGARRYTTVDLEASNALGRVVYDEANAFSERGDDVFKWDISCSYSWNKKGTRQEINLAVQNLTGNEAVVDQYYNSSSNKTETSKQLPMFPTIMYTLEF